MERFAKRDSKCLIFDGICKLHLIIKFILFITFIYLFIYLPVYIDHWPISNLQASSIIVMEANKWYIDRILVIKGRKLSESGSMLGSLYWETVLKLDSLSTELQSHSHSAFCILQNTPAFV